MAVLAGGKGFLLACALAGWVIFALWLSGVGGPSAAGEPFRFSPPTPTPPAVSPPAGV